MKWLDHLSDDLFYALVNYQIFEIPRDNASINAIFSIEDPGKRKKYSFLKIVVPFLSLRLSYYHNNANN